ncbi:MAG: hypothetical protein IPP83_09530 [Flavobacteriales bacterium]|nr:hypothetical protein [Flavobacteriales bacterium]
MNVRDIATWIPWSCSFTALLSVPLQGMGQLMLDPSFSPQLLQQVTHVRDVMPIPDGRTVIVEFWEGGLGEAQFYNELACLHGDGSRDTGYAQLGGVYALLPWNEGAFYMWRGYYPNYVQRYHVANGMVDPAFQVATNAWPGRYRIDDLQNVSVDGEGRIYLVGWIRLLNEAQEVIATRDLVRLDVHGDLDTTFTPASSPYLSAVFPMPDGRVLLSGNQGSYNGIPVPRIFMVHDDGTIDTGFSTGFMRANTQCVLPLPDGSLIATGSFINFISLIELDTANVVRLLPSGAQDLAFASDLRAYQEWNSGYYTMVNSIVEWGQDRYLISGNFDLVNGLPKRGLAMLDANGVLIPEECDWPGPGAVDGQVWLNLVKDGEGAVFAHGTFDGFDDGTTIRATKGLARFINGPVGLPEGSAMDASGVRVFPVPAQEQVTIQGSGEWQRTIRRVDLLDASGRITRALVANGTEAALRVDLRGLAPGSYLVRIMIDEATVHYHKILVVP